jgi:hypothetical protein
MMLMHPASRLGTVHRHAAVAAPPAVRHTIGYRPHGPAQYAGAGAPCVASTPSRSPRAYILCLSTIAIYRLRWPVCIQVWLPTQALWKEAALASMVGDLAVGGPLLGLPSVLGPLHCATSITCQCCVAAKLGLCGPQ